MLGSDYRELIVPKRDNQSKKITILVGGAALTLLCLILAFTVHMLFLLGALAFGFGTWYLWTQNSIEYEYVISGDELVITKILAQSKRKPMLTVSILKFTAFGNLTAAPQPHENQTLVLACAEQDSSTFYADFNHAEYGQCRLLISPNDDILSYLAKKLPRNIGFHWESSGKAENAQQF